MASTQAPLYFHALRDVVDRQIMDHDSKMVGKVDDLRFERRDTAMVMTEVLTGGIALGRRITGRLGYVFETVVGTLTHRAEPTVVPVALMRRTRTNVELTVTRHELAAWNEQRAVPSRVEALDAADVFRLSDLVGAQVIDVTGAPLGRVGDARLASEAADTPFRLDGFIVGATEIGDRLGYGYQPGGNARRPVPLSTLLKRIARHARYVPWDVVAARERRAVRLAVGKDDLRTLAEVSEDVQR